MLCWRIIPIYLRFIHDSWQKHKMPPIKRIHIYENFILWQWKLYILNHRMKLSLLAWVLERSGNFRILVWKLVCVWLNFQLKLEVFICFKVNSVDWVFALIQNMYINFMRRWWRFDRDIFYLCFYKESCVKRQFMVIAV